MLKKPALHNVRRQKYGIVNVAVIQLVSILLYCTFCVVMNNNKIIM